MDFYVYAHRKATTGEIFYIGKGTGCRAFHSTKRSKHWKSIVAKHGLIVEIVRDGLQEWYAHELEQDLIALHGRRDCGYGQLINLTDGGEGRSGSIPSANTRAKLSEASKRSASNPEYCAKISASLRGITRSQETRAKMSAAQRKQAQNPKWREKLAVANRGKVMSEESRAKMSLAKINLSACPEFRAKMSALQRKRAKPIICIETGQLFETSCCAEKWLKRNDNPKAQRSKIAACCKGRSKIAYGYTWRYAEASANASPAAQNAASLVE